MDRSRRGVNGRFSAIMDAIDPVGDSENEARNGDAGPAMRQVQFPFVPRLDRPPEMPLAGASNWSDTLAWIGANDAAIGESEKEKPLPLDKKGPLPSDSDSVGAELGLWDNATRADIRRIRRQFAVRNHPDMLDASERDEATQRMTIANMLLDEALKRLG
jgi:hypothetical protein